MEQISVSVRHRIVKMHGKNSHYTHTRTHAIKTHRKWLAEYHFSSQSTFITKNHSFIIIFLVSF